MSHFRIGWRLIYRGREVSHIVLDLLQLRTGGEKVLVSVSGLQPLEEVAFSSQISNHMPVLLLMCVLPLLRLLLLPVGVLVVVVLMLFSFLFIILVIVLILVSTVLLITVLVTIKIDTRSKFAKDCARFFPMSNLVIYVSLSLWLAAGLQSDDVRLTSSSLYTLCTCHVLVRSVSCFYRVTEHALWFYGYQCVQ